jgi:single-strand DNA-binding protein
MDADGVNEVHLVGRVSAVLDERVLPSGDSVVAMRVVVPRAGTTTSGSRATVDVIDVACWTASTRRTASRLAPGDGVELTGALHRRFFRAGAAVQSRYEVAAHRITRSKAVVADAVAQ